MNGTNHDLETSQVKSQTNEPTPKKLVVSLLPEHPASKPLVKALKPNYREVKKQQPASKLPKMIENLLAQQSHER